MDFEAVSGIVGFVRRDWGEYGYRVVGMKQLGWTGGAIAVIGCSDGSRFVVTSDRYGNAELVAEGTNLEAEAFKVIGR